MTSSTLREDLYRVATQGVRFALHLPDGPLSNRLVDGLFGKFFRGVIDTAVTFDEMIEETSLNQACAWISSICGEPPVVYGAENIPVDGPLLLTSNHPGYFEGMLTISLLPRDDLKMMAAGVPYFDQLPNTRSNVFYTDYSMSGNVSALRQAISHLKNDGMFLIYPTGQADPDPDAMPGILERIDDWSDSIALMIRRVPETALVPVVVSGIVNPRFLRHPLALIQRERRSRIRVAELFQMYRQFGTDDCPPLSKPRISFGKPVRGTEIISRAGRKGVMAEIIRIAKEEHIAHQNRRDQPSH